MAIYTRGDYTNSIKVQFLKNMYTYIGEQQSYSHKSLNGDFSIRQFQNWPIYGEKVPAAVKGSLTIFTDEVDKIVTWSRS